MTVNRFSQSEDSLRPNLLGKLLVAAPRVPVGFPFSRAVILVLQDSEEGLFGVVLNRPASPEMLLAWQQVSGPVFGAEKLVAGGPVQGPVLAIHREEELAEVELNEGVFVSVQKDAIEQLSELEMDESNAPFRIVMGAVNWEPGQLQHEIDNGAWLLLDSDAEQIFVDPSIMWESSIREYGLRTICEMTGITTFPVDPTLN